MLWQLKLRRSRFRLVLNFVAVVVVVVVIVTALAFSRHAWLSLFHCVNSSTSLSSYDCLVDFRLVRCIRPFKAPRVIFRDLRSYSILVSLILTWWSIFWPCATTKMRLVNKGALCAVMISSFFSILALT